MPCEIVSQPLNCTTAARWELIALLSQDLESALFCCQVPERLTHGGLSGVCNSFHCYHPQNDCLQSQHLLKPLQAPC